VSIDKTDWMQTQSSIVDLIVRLHARAADDFMVGFDNIRRPVSFKHAAENLCASESTMRSVMSGLTARQEDFWPVAVTQLWILFDAAMVCIRLKDGREFANVSLGDRQQFFAQLNDIWRSNLRQVAENAWFGEVRWNGTCHSPRLNTAFQLLELHFTEHKNGPAGVLHVLLDDRTPWAKRFKDPEKDEAQDLRNIFLSKEGIDVFLPTLIASWRYFEKSGGVSTPASREIFNTGVLRVKAQLKEREAASRFIQEWVNRTPYLSNLLTKLSGAIRGKLALPGGDPKALLLFLVGEQVAEREVFSYVFDPSMMRRLLDKDGPMADDLPSFCRLWEYRWHAENSVIGRFEELGEYPLFVPEVKCDSAWCEYAQKTDPDVSELEVRLFKAAQIPASSISQAFLLPLYSSERVMGRWSVPLAMVCLVPGEHSPMSVREMMRLIEIGWAAKSLVEQAFKADMLHRNIQQGVWRQVSADFAHTIANDSTAFGALFKLRYSHWPGLSEREKIVLSQFSPFMNVLGWMCETWRYQGMWDNFDQVRAHFKTKGETPEIDIVEKIRHVIETYQMWRCPDLSKAEHDKIQDVSVRSLTTSNPYIRNILVAVFNAVIIEMLQNYLKHAAMPGFHILIDKKEDKVIIFFENKCFADTITKYNTLGNIHRGKAQVARYVNELLGGKIVFPNEDNGSTIWRVTLTFPANGARCE